MVLAVLKSPRVLFIRTDRLGDTLLNLPAVAAMKQHLPGSVITVLADPAVAPLLARHPAIHEVWSCQTGSGSLWWWRAVRLARRLRTGRFHVAIVSNPHKVLHLAVFLAGIPIRVGYARKWGWTLTHTLQDDKAAAEFHEIEYNLRLLKRLGIDVPTIPSFQLPVSGDDQAAVASLLESLRVRDTDDLVAVHPWTSNPAKRWPTVRFQQLIQQLTKLPGVRPVIIGGQDALPHVHGIMDNVSERVCNVVGRLSLGELAALLQRVRVLVTNDSGPMHVAAAVGTPVIALFGTSNPGSHPKRWGPWGSHHTVIHKPLQDITVEQVLKALGRYVPCVCG